MTANGIRKIQFGLIANIWRVGALEFLFSGFRHKAILDKVTDVRFGYG
jgi:hypothetical protein